MTQETVGSVLEILRYYSPEAPIAAKELGWKLGHRCGAESLRRRGREAFRAARLAYPDKCGSNEHGYYLIRTREDREQAKGFLRGHGLSELHTASLKRQPEQSNLFAEAKCTS